MTVEMLSGPHLSKLRNPLIADAFYQTGAVEIWGQGTNRVIDACAQYGVKPPTFEETAGAVVVTFRASIAIGAERRHQVGTKSAISEHQVQVLDVAHDPQPMHELMRVCKRSDRNKFRNQVLRPLLDAGLIEMTIPEKPTSSQQRYCLTENGKRIRSAPDGETE